jgi:hypothetical protein
MRGITTLWFLAGLLIGVLHIQLLWRAAQPPFQGVAVVLLRLLSVAAVFVGAALMGGLLPAACGWGGGFTISAIVTSVWK